MTQKVDFIYDFGSPNAYYAHCVIPEIETRHDVKFEYVPVLLGGIFKAIGNVSPGVSLKDIPNKLNYVLLETKRWLQRYPVEQFEWNPDFPTNTLMVMRGAAYARDKDFYEQYVRAIFSNMWGSPKKLDEVEVFSGVLKESGLPAEEILEAIQTADVKTALLDSTNAAVERGTFGCPTFFYNDEIYFGKEKLRDIEEFLVA